MMRFIALLSLFALSACGFQPVYAPGASGATTANGQITIEPIKGRAGHSLRKALLQEFSIGLPGVDEPATLVIELNENLSRLAFRPDGAASRSNVRLRARYTLAKESGAVNGVVAAETAFNVPDAPYGDIAAQTSASERAADLLARRLIADIRLQLATD